MANYYIDYENVHNEGLKGLSKLEAGDRLNLFYSNKADTLKIDVVRKLMKCPAEIDFVKILNGVENALDFQLITALMCNYTPEEKYYIISRDKGYDAAIEMANQQKRNTIFRCKDIDGAIKHQNNLGIDESDLEVIVDLELDEPEDEPGYDVDEVLETNEALEADNEQMLNQPTEQVVEEMDEQQPDIQPEEQTVPEVEQNIAECQPEQSAANAVEGIGEAEEAVKAEEALSVAEDEKARRAYQSVCTKILNTLKNNHKIPVYYRQAGAIYEALAESDNKMQFYHRLIQTLGRKKGGELYQRVKTAYKSLAALYKASAAAEQVAGQEDVAAVPSEAKSITEQVMDALVDDMLESDNPEAEAAAVVAAIKAEIVKDQVKGKAKAKRAAKSEAKPVQEPENTNEELPPEAGKEGSEDKPAAKKRNYKRSSRTNSRSTNRRSRKPKAAEEVSSPTE